MKKIFLVVAALGMLATSCTKDDAAVAGGESLVSFTIDSPELQTRYGEGEEATVLHYAFYNEDGILEAISATTDEKAVALVGGKAKINVSLVEGRKYSAIFWASAPDAAEVYDVNWTAKTVEMATNLTANDESYDAFYNYTINIDPARKTHRIELRRPFAQINIATADKAAASSAGFDAAATKVTLKAYNKLQFAVKDVEGVATPVAEVAGEMVPFTYGWAENATGTVSVDGKDFSMLSMNYVLVDARTLVNVKMEVSEDATNFTAPITREYTTVPVQRNYRTYIVGNLLTTPNDFEIETKPGFEDDDEEYGVIDGQVYHEVDSTPEFVAALNDPDVDMVILTGDINLNDPTMRSTEDEDKTITIAAGREFTIDLGGHKLSATSAQTGNREIFLVKGTLTVKNGTMEYEHVGENMEWNSMTTIFDVTAGGVLNLDGVTAKNLGGSDMGFVAHLNNWGEVTLNVNNSTLESNYVAVRVFNSGNDMNNVTIKNSTLKGASVAFWVHNYTVEDFGTQAKADAHKALLNFDIFNGTNTFEGTARFGMTNSFRYTVVNTAEELAAAFTEGGAYALNKNIETTSLTLANGKEVVLNLAGNTLSGVDEGTASYGLINNKGNLTINDIKGTGKIQLSATQNRGWNAYSSVISNNPGGVLVVNDGLLEHLGGTDMAYGIDNLTNGKGTSAVATINGGVVKSPYRAIRQFLNGIEATNSLTVNGGVIEGANKSIWMQDPSKNANTGSLVVAAAAQLKGDVYLYVTAGSKEWPVEVSIASAALVGESDVLTSNVPANYAVALENGVWVNVSSTTTVTVPENNTEVEVSAETVNVTIPADAAQAGDNYMIVVNNESTETDTTTGETTVAFDLTLYKNNVKVSGDVIYEVTKNIGAGKIISEVKHNGTALTKATTGADQTYTYDLTTGVLTIYTKSFSPFAITYADYKDYVKKLNRGHSVNSTISISTGADFLPIVAVNPEIYGCSVFDGDTRITDQVVFRFSDVKKETINENSYKVSVNLAILDDKGNNLELKPGMPSTINGKEYLHVYMNLIEVPAGYSISTVKVNDSTFTLTNNASGNPATGEYWIGSDTKDIYLQSKTAGLIEVTLTK